jgi:hypothetical protein
MRAGRSTLMILTVLLGILAALGSSAWAAESQRQILSVDWYRYSDAVAIAEGDAQTLADYTFTNVVDITDTDSDQDNDTLKIAWDTSGVDVNTPGLYQARGTLVLPAGTTLAPGMTLPDIAIPISVQTPGEPQIDAFLTGRGTIIFPWVAGDIDPQQMNVWLAKDGGEYEELGAEQISYLDANQLMLKTRTFEEGVPYDLQVRYPGGQTGVMHLVLSDGDYIFNYNSGNRDGDDAVEPGTGGQTQLTAPSIGSREVYASETNGAAAAGISSGTSETPEAGSSSGSNALSSGEAAAASDSGNSRSITGAALRQMESDYPGGVPFGWNGIMLVLPQSLVDGLGLSDDGTLTVTLIRNDDYSISVALAANGQTISAVPGAKVSISLPEAVESGDLYINGVKEDVNVQLSDNVLTFPIEKTGSYRFDPVVIQGTTQAAPPVWGSGVAASALAVIVILTVVGLTFWIAKKNNGDHGKVV